MAANKTSAATWTPAGLPAQLALALGVFSLVHRLRLWSGLVDDVAPDGGVDPLRVAIGGAWQDAAVALLVALLALLVAIVGRKLLKNQTIRLVVGLVFAAPLLAAIGAVAQTHLRTLHALHSGLSWSVLVETIDAGELTAVLTQAGWRDTLFSLLPVGLACAIAVPLRARPQLGLGLATTILAVLVGTSLSLGQPAPADLPLEANASPIAFTVLDIARHFHEREDDDNPTDGHEKNGLVASAHATEPRPGGLADDPSSTAEDAEEPLAAGPVAGEGALRLDEPRYVAAAKVTKQVPAQTGKKWNVVWLILESHGRRYLQGDTPKGLQPMPFLVDDLAKRGWWLAKHRSPSNSSATSIFAQLSGLYPSPSTKMFSVQKDNHVPSLFNLLGPEYERFLVTPGKLSFFFPRHFLLHGAMTEMHGYDELRHITAMASENMVRHEVDTVSFFLQRLKKAKPPFAAVYYTFTPHWEYLDYGPKWKRFGGGRAIERYWNGLYLVDTQIQRIVKQLEDDGLLDSTILVIAGDHGEAFGQHERNYAHSRASYEENYSTPGLIVQPKLFAPKVIDHDTLHIDLLPTVLDAMGIAYDDALLQGESLWQDKMRRKYQFFWGNENTISAIRDDGLKVQLALGDQKCWAYDLVKDPKEKSRLGCDKYKSDLDTLKAWRDRQRRTLTAYSAAVAKGQPFAGHRHPQLHGTTADAK